jgi:succinate dehydrogenase flavin-adding protein (antitoxin of CptAB toxin-antitoxin module)
MFRHAASPRPVPLSSAFNPALGSTKPSGRPLRPFADQSSGIKPSAAASDMSVYRKKLTYRSKSRGMKENILLLGTFATKHLEGFGSGQLAEWEHILEKDDPDLFNWITGKQPPPADLASSAVFRQLQRHARSDPLTVIAASRTPLISPAGLLGSPVPLDYVTSCLPLTA